MNCLQLYFMKKIVLCLICISLLTPCAFSQQNVNSSFSQRDFMTPPGQNRVHVWWHWSEGAITREGITRDLESMKRQGIVQATILSITFSPEMELGLTRVKFGSKEWYELYQWAAQEANRVGITIGVNNVDGWGTSGGPWITPEMSMKQYQWTKTLVTGGEKVSLQLPKPYSLEGFHKDVAVIAYPSNEKQNSFHSANPKVLYNGHDASALTDGNPVSEVKLKRGEFHLKAGDEITFEFKVPFSMSKVSFYPHLPLDWNHLKYKTSFSLNTSNDGINYQKINDLDFIGLNKNIIRDVPPVTAKYFKMVCTFTDNSPYDNGYLHYASLGISEMELLHGNERPGYSPAIAALEAKTNMARPENLSSFDIQDYVATPIDPSTIIDISDKMAADGKLIWDAPKGNWCVLRFGYTTTGMVNGPASPEGIGLECDKFDSTALNLHFRNYTQKQIDNAGTYKGNTFNHIFVDSWESGYQNWTARMPEEFQKHCGYSLIKWIPALCGEVVGSVEKSEAFLYDFRMTIADVFLINYYQQLANLGHRNGLEFHYEAIYGGDVSFPLDILKANSVGDVPMYEFWSSTNRKHLVEYTPRANPETSFPTYATVLYDKKLLPAEAFTTESLFSTAPQELKSIADNAFCSGINQMVLHGYTAQPDDRKPGMTMVDWGTEFNRNNPVWEYSADFMTYLSRIQYVLQQGYDARDILFYVGDQQPQEKKNRIADNLPFGYRANACNFDALMNKLSVENGKIILNGKIPYALLVMPDFPAMNFATLVRLAELVRQGAVIYGDKPLQMFSMHDISNNKIEFAALTDSLWGNESKSDVHYGKGRVIAGQPIAKLLPELGVIKEFTTGLPDSLNLMYFYKRVEKSDVFFVANQTQKPLYREFVFRTSGKIPEIWNPATGSVTKPAIYSVTENTIRIPIKLHPQESLIFIFNEGNSVKHIEKVSLKNSQVFPEKELINNAISVPEVSIEANNFILSTERTGDYQFFMNTGKVLKTTLEQPQVYSIDTFKGLLEFFPEYKAEIAPVKITKLQSLTDFSEPDIKYYSGKTKYTITFDLPSDLAKTNDSVLFNLGSFDAVAEVRLNDKPLGKIWLNDFSLNVSGLLKANNTLEVWIVNPYRNRILGDLLEFGKLKNLWTGMHKLKTTDILKPSGLFGPLTLTRYRKQNIAIP